MLEFFREPFKIYFLMYILKWMACAVEDFVWMEPNFMESSTQVKILKGLNPGGISNPF